MDRTDEQILRLLQGNARMTYQELGDAIKMSRVAAKKLLSMSARKRLIFDRFLPLQ